MVNVSGTGSVQRDIHDTSFDAWLANNDKSMKTASNYAGAIAGRLKALAEQLTEPSFSLSLIDSASNFEKFCKAHDASNEILELNVRGKDMYRRALVWYAKYLAHQASPVTLQDFEDGFRAKISQSLKDSPATRLSRLANADKTAKKLFVVTVAYVRNPEVVAQVLLDAKGTCLNCGRHAPFNRRSDNSPYLEVHHKTPLSMGGEDSVANAIALCPNCHRKMHYGI